MISWLPSAVPEEVALGELTFVPLTPAMVEPDYAAVMRDVPTLRAWSGQDWPTDDFPIESNLDDLQRHDREQQEGIALTYSVLLNGEVQGCIYVWPFVGSLNGRGIEVPRDAELPVDDVVVRGWLHDAPAATLIDACFAWLTAPPFTFPRLWWQTNSECPAQLAACDDLGLTDSYEFRGTDRTWVLRSAPTP